MNLKDDLKVEINNCRCHPETCCCDGYYVQMPYDDRIPFFSRERAERFVEWVKELKDDQNRSS